jgi:hypothetical protein
LIHRKQKLFAQPQHIASLNYDNPIAQRVLGAFTGGPGPVEIVRSVLATGTIGVGETTPRGRAYVLPSSQTLWNTKRIAGLDPFVGDTVTVNWHGYLKANTAQSVLGCQDGYGWVVRTYGWGATSIRAAGGFVWRGSAAITAALPLDFTVPHSIAIRFHPSWLVDVFVDGQMKVSSTIPAEGGAIGANQSFFALGVASNPHSTLSAQACTGYLTDAEILSLHLDPWQVYRAAPRRIFPASAPVGGTAIPVFIHHYRNQGMM